MENLQMDLANQKVKQLIEQNVKRQVLRMFVCSNIDEIFNTNINLEQERKEQKEIFWDSIAEKIIINYPRFYRFLCILRINKIYAKIMGR